MSEAEDGALMLLPHGATKQSLALTCTGGNNKQQIKNNGRVVCEYLLLEIGDASDWNAAWISSRQGSGWMRQQLMKTFFTAFFAYNKQ